MPPLSERCLLGFASGRSSAAGGRSRATLFEEFESSSSFPLFLCFLDRERERERERERPERCCVCKLSGASFLLALWRGELRPGGDSFFFRVLEVEFFFEALPPLRGDLGRRLSCCRRRSLFSRARLRDLSLALKRIGRCGSRQQQKKKTVLARTFLLRLLFSGLSHQARKTKGKKSIQDIDLHPVGFEPTPLSRPV